MVRVFAIALAVLALLLPVYLRGCAGPRPRVVATALETSPAGVFPRARVKNDGGPGQIEVRFRILEVASGRTIAADGEAQIERGEELEVRAQSALPPGEYEVEAEAEYPPN